MIIMLKYFRLVDWKNFSEAALRHHSGHKNILKKNLESQQRGVNWCDIIVIANFQTRAQISIY